jgi:hypothetical protein
MIVESKVTTTSLNLLPKPPDQQRNYSSLATSPYAQTVQTPYPNRIMLQIQSLIAFSTASIINSQHFTPHHARPTLLTPSPTSLVTSFHRTLHSPSISNIFSERDPSSRGTLPVRARQHTII